jgi:hypothetical protein
MKAESSEVMRMKEIDIYLIAGQSNASGHTKVRDAEAIYRQYPELRAGYDHVHYAGNSRVDADNFKALVNRDFPWCRTRLGLGIRHDGYMGPEAGMAAGLSAIYNKESGRHAGLIKFAHGGTGLLDNRVRSNLFGNWMPPSYAKLIGVPWENEPITGVLYRLLLAQVEKDLRELRYYGDFDKVNIKGMYWMQGCHNRGVPQEYRRAFPLFAADIRRDLAAVLTGLYGEDCGAAEMPIVVGTISRTFMIDGPGMIERINVPFIEMQRSLPEVVPGCYVADNSEYAICAWDEAEGKVIPLGTDTAHWNQQDALDIGVGVGKIFCDLAQGTCQD